MTILSSATQQLLTSAREVTFTDQRHATMSVIHEIAKDRGDLNDKDARAQMIKAIGWSTGCLDASPEVQLDDVLDELGAEGWIEENEQGELLLSPERDAQFNELVFELASQDEANYEPTPAPYVWTHAQQDLMSLVPKGHPKMFRQYDKAHSVLRSVNKMQAIAYVADPVLGTISDLQDFMVSEMAGEGDKRSRTVQYNRYQLYVKQANEMYFTQTLDFRGRMYFRGLLNPSNVGDFGKAAFQFAEQKPMTRGAFEALSIHYANVAGHDKKSIKARLAWANKSGADLALAIRNKSVAEIREASGEKKVFCLYVAAQEWLRVHTALKRGETVTSGFIVRQDGKCNGVQHGAVLSKCRDTAINVSLVAQSKSETPADIYRVFLDVLVSKIGHDHGGLIDRTFCKQPVMTRGYGAGRAAIQNSILSLLDKANKLQYDQNRKMLMDLLTDTTDNEGEPHRSVLMDLIMDTLDVVIAGMAACTQTLRDALADRAAQQLSTYWKTQDGFPVRVEGQVLDGSCFDVLHLEPMQQSGSQFCNKRWVVRNNEPMMISEELSEQATIKGIAPNFIHSIDANHVRAVVNSTSASIVHTHDDIGCHAIDYFAVNTSVRETFVALHSEFDWIGSLEEYSNVSVQRMSGSYDVQEALQATYMFS